MIALGAIVLYGANAQLTNHQCASTAAVSNRNITTEVAHWCGCNFDGASFEYVPAAGSCVERNNSIFSNAPYVVTGTVISSEPNRSFLVAYGERGCFLRCAVDPRCEAATATIVPPADTRCSLYYSPTAAPTPASAGERTVHFNRTFTSVAPIDAAVVMCPSDRPLASADRSTCHASADNCPAGVTGDQRRSPPSGGLRIRDGDLSVPGYLIPSPNNFASAGRNGWWLDPMIGIGTVGYLFIKNSAFQSPDTPAQFQISNASTAFYVNGTIESRNCNQTPATFYSPQMCRVDATIVPNVTTSDSPCKCEHTAVSKNALAWDFRSLINGIPVNRCRLFFDHLCYADYNSSTSETNSQDCNSGVCRSSFYPRATYVYATHVFDESRTPNFAAAGDGYHLGDVLEFKRDNTNIHLPQLSITVSENMFYERYDTVSCVHANCSLMKDAAQCRCKCAPPVKCPFFACFDFDDAGITDPASACGVLTGIFRSGTGARLNVSIVSAVDLVVRHDEVEYAAQCRYGAIKFETEDGPARIDAAGNDGPLGSIKITAPAGVGLDKVWSAVNVPGPSAPQPQYVPPVPPPPSPKYSLHQKSWIGVGVAIALLIVAIGGFFLYRHLRKRLKPKRGVRDSARQALLATWT